MVRKIFSLYLLLFSSSLKDCLFFLISFSSNFDFLGTIYIRGQQRQPRQGPERLKSSGPLFFPPLYKAVILQGSWLIEKRDKQLITLDNQIQSLQLLVIRRDER